MLRVSFKSWLGSWQDWAVIILLFIALEIAVRSVEQAQWITPQPSLTVVLALAMLTGWLLSNGRLPGTVTHPLAVVLGAAVTVWQTSNLLPTLETASKFKQLIVALQPWWQAVSIAKPSESTIHFAIFLIFSTWIIGYISTWFILRRQNAWVAVSLGTITILANLSNLPEQYYTFFLLYVLAALLLVGMTNLAKHHYWFNKHGISYPNRGIIYFMASLLCLSILAVSAAWLTPEVRVERFETLISTKTPWRKNVEGYFVNFLAAVPAKQPFLKSDEQSALFFGDSSFDRGNALQFLIFSERPYYLRTRMHDIYTSSSWTSSKATEHMFRQGILNTEAEGISKRSEITYTVVTKLRTDILLTAGEFISSDTPASRQTLTPLSFNIDLLHPANDRSLPPDVASLARSFRAVQTASKEIGPDELKQLLPEELILTGISAARYSPAEVDYTIEPIFDSAQLTTIEVTRTQLGIRDTIAITAPRFLRPDQSYTVTTSISSATPSDLSEAGDDYPYWVTDYYLQLPPTLPERIRQLSETVTKEAKSPYDKVLAIKHYLSQIDYSLEIEAPPQGVDGVDYFLFTQKSGNCVQFTSAMAVMLRSIGVPSRVSRGYAPSGWDAATGSSTLRAKQHHAWPEVYFPSYGWVEFEATPGIDGEFEAAIPTDNIIVGDNERLMDEDDDDEMSGTGFPRPSTRTQSGLTLPFIIIGLILFIFIIWSFFSRRHRRFMRSDYASEIYRKMCFLASLLRLGPKPQQTPLEYCARLASAIPLQAEALDCIVQTYVESRFSHRKEVGSKQRWRLQKSWREVYPVLLKRLLHIRYWPILSPRRFL
ncbi:DUF4129 domain-containing transglutaminase family protein [Chloroflexota bacterium]